ncbi:MAG: DUF1127 domain-containing protein [Pseudomonadota bacterium]
MFEYDANRQEAILHAARAMRAAYVAEWTGRVGGAMARLFAGIAARYRAWRRRQRAYDELMSLDDRALADIGLSRGDIPAVAAGRYVPFRGLVGTAESAPPSNANRPNIAA